MADREDSSSTPGKWEHGDFSKFLQLTESETLQVDEAYHKSKLDEDYLSSLMRISSEATPGPWYPRAGDDNLCMNARWVSTSPGKGFVHDGFIQDEDSLSVIAITLLQSPALALITDLNDTNLQLICKYREAVPLLVEEVRRLRKELAGGH